MRFSDKVKIVYLSLVILFASGVFVYLLDTWGIIRLEEYIPYLSSEPPRVPDDQDSPTELALERLKKEQEKLEEEKQKLQEMKADLEIKNEEFQKKMAELDEKQKGITDEKVQLESRRKSESTRQLKIDQMSRRLNDMPPDDAVAIVAGWSNSDLVDVFLQMEKNAENEGRPSIVPYLLTKLPRERAAIVTTLMMDEKARLLPDR